MGEIVAQLVYDGDYESKTGCASATELAPWVAMRMPPRQQRIEIMRAQRQNEAVLRRIIKTHEPVETMPFRADIKYLCVARDYRDVVWSWFNHHSLMTDAAYAKFNAPADFDFKPFPKFNFDDGA